MPARNLIIVFFAAVISLTCYQKAQRYRYAETITEAVNTIEQRYVEEVDPRRLFENAMNGMVQGLDRYSSYIGPDRYQQFQESLDQQFGGIGIMVEGPPRLPRMTVTTPLVGTPAFKAGMLAGDVILEIEGKSTEGMQLEDAVKLMRGEKGSPVTLLVQHPGAEAPVSMTIRRDIIPIESVLGDQRLPDGSWEYFLQEDPRIGFIRVTTFGDRTVGELREALKFPGQDIQGLIIDLRGNNGGLLDAAVETCDLFIRQGTIVSTRGRGGVIQHEYSATDDVAFSPRVPMVVLVDQFSASAAEIVAACLMDQGRAIVVGQRTFGKGTVQNILDLEGGRSALKLTTARYWRPSGKNIHRADDATEDDEWGVRPTPGYEVVLDEDEYTKVRMQRRERDLQIITESPSTSEQLPDISNAPEVIPDADSSLAPPSSETTDDDRPAPPSIATSDTDAQSESTGNDEGPAEDRQLLRTIEYLHKKFANESDESKAA